MYAQERDTILHPHFQEAIHDERIDERLARLKPYMKKYEGVDISYFSKNYSQKKQLEAIKGWEKFVNNSVVNERMEELEKQFTMAKNVLGTQDYDFTQFKRGWKESKLEERLSLLTNYKKQFVNTVLPALEEHQRVYAIRETQDIKEDVIEKQLDEARKVMGSQDQNLAFTKGWKDANVSERKLLLTKYKKRYKYAVAPRLHAKLSGIKTDFESAAQTDLKYRDKFGRAQQSMIIGRTLIMGDVVKSQKGASSKHTVVQG